MKTLYLSALVLILSACSQNNQYAHLEGGRSQTGQPALHAVRDNRLHELMDRMDSLMQERFMTEQQLDVERRKYSRQIGEAARDLAANVETMIAQLPRLQLNAVEQTTFLALAGKLREEMRQLQQLAEQNHIDAIPDSLHEINTTCTSCHALFRKLGG
ncbi:cytochrome c [Methylomonas sp. MK1]|uniref:cytochrome c n=1 Tax=Methylomonas sp. MK1 TaxID=1131552 RepID=UPI000379914E|nr:cytochrome c [Methylomonas sp. MK1]